MIIYDLLWGNSFARSFIGSFMVLLRILGMAGECWGHLGPEFCRLAPGWLQRLLCMKCSQPLSLCAHLSVSSSPAAKSHTAWIASATMFR